LGVGSDVLTPQTTADLAATAQAQATQQTTAAEAPYQNQIDLYQTQAKQAAGDVSSEYASLLPQVQAAATSVQGANDQALAAEQSIWQSAGTRLNQLAQSQASEAQQMAQQIGGPVGGTALLTEGLEPYMAAFPSAEAGSLLNALGLSQAGEQMAETFAGRVFPAMQTEDEAKARNFYDDKISTAQDSINSLESQKAGLVNDKYTTLLQNERQFELDLATKQADALKAQRDWTVAQHTLKNDDTRLAIEEGNYQDSRAKTAADITHISTQDRLAAERLGITAQHYTVLAQHYQETTAIAQQRADVQQRTNAMSLLDAAMGYSKAITLTQKQVLSGAQLNSVQLSLIQGKRVPDVWYDGKTKQWYQYQRVTQTPQEWAQAGGPNGATHITDPNQLYSILIGANVNKSLAESLIKARTGLGDWAPGKQVNYAAPDLAQKSLDELRGIATQRGLKSATGVKNKQRLMDFIMAHNPAAATGTNAGGAGPGNILTPPGG
jgi:hypothetical protein